MVTSKTPEQAVRDVRYWFENTPRGNGSPADTYLTIADAYEKERDLRHKLEREVEGLRKERLNIQDLRKHVRELRKQLEECRASKNNKE